MDTIDRAKEAERADRDRALADQLARAAEADAGEQWIVDGAVVCIECEEPIPEDRLRARPNAVRCVDCKQDLERQKQLTGLHLGCGESLQGRDHV